MGKAQFAITLCEVAPESVYDSAGVGIETRTGDADHLDPVQLQLLLAQPVALERRVTAMGLVDIEFDRKAQIRPVHIEHETVDCNVRRWGRQTAAADGSQETALELGERQVFGNVDPQGTPQGSNPVMATGTSQEGFNCVEIEEASPLGEVQEAFEAMGCSGGDIEEGARHRGNRNAVDDGTVLRLEYLRVVDANRQPGPAAHRTGDVKRRRTPTIDLPEPSCRQVA